MRCCSNSTQAGTTNWLHIDLLFCWLHPLWDVFLFSFMIQLYGYTYILVDIHIYIYTYCIYTYTYIHIIFIYIYIYIYTHNVHIPGESTRVSWFQPLQRCPARGPGLLSKLPDLQSLVILVSAKGKQRSYPAGRKRPPDFSHFFGWSHFECLSILLHPFYHFGPDYN